MTPIPASITRSGNLRSAIGSSRMTFPIRYPFAGIIRKLDRNASSETMKVTAAVVPLQWLAPGAGGPREVLVIQHHVGPARGRRRVTEGQVDVHARKARRIGQPAAADIHDVRAGLEMPSIEHGHRRIRACRDDV